MLQARTEQPRLYKSPDDPDHDFNAAVADRALVEDAFATWKSEIAKAERWLAAEPDLGARVAVHDETASVRDILVHVIEEYARHAGHADLLRECIDGRTGE